MPEKRTRTPLEDAEAVQAAAEDAVVKKKQLAGKEGLEDDLDGDIDDDELAAAMEAEAEDEEAPGTTIPTATMTEEGDMVREPEPDFNWVESPLMLRKIIKNLSGVLLDCIFEICDPLNDGTPNSEKPFIRVKAMDPTELAVAEMIYYPMELQKNIKQTCEFKIKLEALKTHVRDKILAPDFEVYLRRFTASTGDTQFLQAVFQKDANLRRRYIATQTIDEERDRAGELEIPERWHVNVPLDIFKSEIKSALPTADQFPNMTFEMRKDKRTGHTYFGMRQEGTDNDCWLSAPCVSSTGADFVEFKVESGGSTARTKKQRDDYFRTDFRRMQPIFEDLTFRTAYLDRFVDSVDQEDFVTLVFSPAIELTNGSIRNSPVVVKYNIGDICRFRFTLMPVDPDEDE